MKTTPSSPFSLPVKSLTHRKRSGNVLIIVCCSMVVLLGCCALAVDYGRMVATKNHLQRTCDASALAGAAELPASDAVRIGNATHHASLTARQNGVNNTEVTIEFPAAQQIRVTANRQVSFLFAPLLGLKSGLVNATALAGRSNVADVPYVSPLAMTVQDYETFKNGALFEGRLVDNNRQDFLNGTIAPLDLREENSGKSTDDFEEDLKWGWYHKIYFDQQTTSVLNASLNSTTQKIKNALKNRIERSGKAPWFNPGPTPDSPYTFPNFKQDDPRILIILVAEQNPANNNNPKLLPRKFAPIYVEKFDDRGQDTYLIGRILPGLTLSNDNGYVKVGDENTPNTGLSVIRLLS